MVNMLHMRLIEKTTSSVKSSVMRVCVVIREPFLKGLSQSRKSWNWVWTWVPNQNMIFFCIKGRVYHNHYLHIFIFQTQLQFFFLLWNTKRETSFLFNICYESPKTPEKYYLYYKSYGAIWWSLFSEPLMTVTRSVSQWVELGNRISDWIIISMNQFIQIGLNDLFTNQWLSDSKSHSQCFWSSL